MPMHACAHGARGQSVAERFAQLGVTSVTVARMDVTAAAPLQAHAILLPRLPALLLLPAGDKAPPHR
jgi:hypothetical protein